MYFSQIYKPHFYSSIRKSSDCVMKFKSMFIRGPDQSFSSVPVSNYTMQNSLLSPMITQKYATPLDFFMHIMVILQVMSNVIIKNRVLAKLIIQAKNKSIYPQNILFCNQGPTLFAILITLALSTAVCVIWLFCLVLRRPF
jgi:hypothetical protein